MLRMIKTLFRGKQSEMAEAKAGRDEPAQGLPQLMGLRLGGSVRLDSLFLSLHEGAGLLEESLSEVMIEALGIIELDESTTILRYYTNDDGFIQVNVSGEIKDHNVTEVMLWYYSDTQGVSDQERWEKALSDMSLKEKAYEGNAYRPVWDNTYDDSLVAMTETVHDLKGNTHVVDEFFMLYQRVIIDSPETYELLMVSGEEKEVGFGDLERCVVTSIGYHLSQNDFTAIS